MNNRSLGLGVALRRMLLVIAAVAVKDGGIVSGRQAIGDIFTKALQPPAKGGQCVRGSLR
jgi:hypothetical protein